MNDSTLSGDNPFQRLVPAFLLVMTIGVIITVLAWSILPTRCNGSCHSSCGMGNRYDRRPFWPLSILWENRRVICDCPQNPPPNRQPSKFTIEHKLDYLIILLHGDDPNKARRSASTLGNMGEQAERAIEDLKAVRNHENERTREAIEKAIEQIERTTSGTQ